MEIPKHLTNERTNERRRREIPQTLPGATGVAAKRSYRIGVDVPNLLSFSYFFFFSSIQNPDFLLSNAYGGKIF